MNVKKIKGDLSQDGIQKIRDELKEYKESLDAKCETFVTKLAKEGITTAKAHTTFLNDLGNLSSVVAFTYELKKSTDGVKAIMYMTDKMPVVRAWLKYGQVKTVEISPSMFYEWGSGQKAVAGHTGTFPSDTAMKNASNPNGWWYMSLDGQWHWTKGVTPTRPMLRAYESMEKNIVRIAKEVFNS